MSHSNRSNTPGNGMNGEVALWIVIFVLMFALPPVGILMLILKLRGYAKPARNPANNQTSSGTHQTNTNDSNWTWQAASSRDNGSTGNRSSSARDSTGSARQAAHDVEMTVREVMREVEATARELKSEFGGIVRDARSQYTNEKKHTMTKGYEEAAREIVNAPDKKARKKKLTPLEKKTSKFVSTLILLISIVLFVGGIYTLAGAMSGFPPLGINSWTEFSLGTLYIIGGIVAFLTRNIGVNRLARFKKYYAIVGGRDIVPMPYIARATGQSPGRVARDIQVMINEGYLGTEAYIDSELGSLVLSSSAADTVRRATRATQEVPVVPDEVPVNQYMAIIIDLRDLNTSIADIAISDKIDRIEAVTAKIFRIVEENPDKLPQIRRFMSYYLPTTQKLLRSYALLEKQGIKGENITAAKESIGRVLDTLATGFEQQLDQLFQSDVIDIAADIDVLENLMQQDGLTGEKPEMKTMESN